MRARRMGAWWGRGACAAVGMRDDAPTAKCKCEWGRSTPVGPIRCARPMGLDARGQALANEQGYNTTLLAFLNAHWFFL
jgi:hypothetical protein